MSKLSRKLIVNADDFGLDAAINKGILTAFKNGIVTNTSIVGCGKAFEEAVHLSRENPELGVGIHLVAINEKRPLCKRENVRTIIDKDGGFYENPYAFIGKFLLGRIDSRQLYLEFDAQIRRVLKAGIMPTHLDSHTNIHIFPPVFNIVLALAKNYKIPCVRIPSEPFGLLSSWRHLSRILMLSTAALWLRKERRILAHEKISCHDACFGIVDAGHLTMPGLKRIFCRLRNGINELICHPGAVEQNLSPAYSWGYRWQEEIEVLCSKQTKETMKDLGIELVNYRKFFGREN